MMTSHTYKLANGTSVTIAALKFSRCSDNGGSSLLQRKKTLKLAVSYTQFMSELFFDLDHKPSSIAPLCVSTPQLPLNSNMFINLSILKEFNTFSLQHETRQTYNVMT